MSPRADNHDPCAQRSAQEMMASVLAAREAAGALRALPAPEESLVDFVSNDYLGLARRSVSADRHSDGSTGSRLLSGTSSLHLEAEEWIAEFHRAESALLFNSGYDANLGLFSSLGRRGSVVILDELCHASIHDGGRLGLGRMLKFRHNDPNDLDRKLAEARRTRGAAGPILVGVESIYSMDGDIAPLREICGVAASHGAELVVDEAHATGIFGPRGEGLVVEQGLESRVLARIHTFGKALGRHGAAVLGSSLLKQYLVNFSRPFIYSTAIPPHTVASILEAYLAMSGASAERQRLFELIAHYERAARGMGVAMPGPIQIVPVGSPGKARALSEDLRSEGINARAILSPTVPAGSERIRVCLHAFNTEHEIDRLVSIVTRESRGEAGCPA